ncbi:MAG: 3-deoxy-7-phosphoheptulonate synthase [Planctomycetota bacterium]
MKQDGDTRLLIVRLRDPLGLDRVLKLCGITSPSPRFRRHAPNLVTVQVDGDPRETHERVAELAEVDRVFALDRGWLHERWPIDPAGEPGAIAGLAFDAGRPVVLAGPCSVEGVAQVRGIAKAVAEAGADGLRGGVFKPRTSPYEFGGLGDDGLAMLVAAGRAHGLPVVTEVLEPGCVEAVAAGADLMQIGSRNMHNAPFLFQLGAHPRGRPALLKRGFGATIDELLWAAEYFLLGRLAGLHDSPGLVLCERGLRGFPTETRFSLDVAAVPVLRRRTRLPVVVDPSHPAGDRELVVPLALAGLAAGASGLLVEVHTDPPRAWCDGAQSLTPEAFGELMQAVRGGSAGPGAKPREGKQATDPHPEPVPPRP